MRPNPSQADFLQYLCQAGRDDLTVLAVFRENLLFLSYFYVADKHKKHPAYAKEEIATIERFQ